MLIFLLSVIALHDEGLVHRLDGQLIRSELLDIQEDLELVRIVAKLTHSTLGSRVQPAFEEN